MTVYAKTPTGYPSVAPYAKSGGVWVQAKELYTKINGTWKQIYLSGGLLDTSVTYVGPNSSLASLAVQSDEKIILYGSFTAYNGVSCPRIIRINKDLSIDTDFLTNVGTGFLLSPYSSVLPHRIAVQSDGKIILVGDDFTNFNGSAVGRIVRLNANGTRDTTFITNTGTGANLGINGVFVDSNDKILIYGDFTSFNGVSKNRLYRLNSDGTADTTFNTNIGTSSTGTVRSVIHIPGTTDYFVVGNFTSFNGTTINRAVALKNDGTLYTTFNTNLGTAFSGQVFGAIADGNNIVAYGSFTTFKGNASRCIVRISNLGVYDATLPAISWNLAQNSAPQIDSMSRHSNGKISALTSGYITGYASNSSIFRLNSDFTLDTKFMSNAGATPLTIYSLSINLNNDKLVLGGIFESYLNNGVYGGASDILLQNLAIVGGDPGY